MHILLINILAVIFCLILGYFFGSIPTAVLIGKIFFHKDPRDYGSHNAGGTNAGRLFGKKIGFLVICLDMLKTVAPMYIVCVLLTFIKFDYSGIKGLAEWTYNFSEVPQMRSLIAPVTDYYTKGGWINTRYAIQFPVYYLVVIGTMFGHCWPIFAKFKGGKAASQFMGISIFSSWMLGLLPGFFYFGTLKWKKYVSLSAILQAIFVSTFCWVWVVLVWTIPSIRTSNLGWLPMYGPLLNADITFAATVTVIGAVMVARHHENIKRLREGTERKITWMK